LLKETHKKIEKTVLKKETKVIETPKKIKRETSGTHFLHTPQNFQKLNYIQNTPYSLQKPYTVLKTINHLHFFECVSANNNYDILYVKYVNY